jgi:flagellar protein FliO/FliZ
MSSMILALEIFVPSSALLAQVDAGGEPPQFDTGASLLWMMVQTIFVLAFMCGLAYVVLRVLPRRAGGVSLSSMVQVIDRVPLDQRKSLYVVKVAGQWLLIGSSETGVHLISELDPKVAEQEAELAVRERPTWGGVSAKARAAFADRLSDLMKKKR